ncbi:MAG: flagellar biosynthesis protein FlhF [Isosphaera sp.]|nr:flagellar biosynthesis protein FlhF [Isosphaera sp.]
MKDSVPAAAGTAHAAGRSSGRAIEPSGSHGRRLMKVKTFRAKSMTHAVDAVKRELGPGAVILHTRVIRSGGLRGVFGLLGRTVVEVTASDDARVSPRPRPGAKPAAQPTQPQLAPAAQPQSQAPLRQPSRSPAHPASPAPPAPTPSPLVHAGPTATPAGQLRAQIEARGSLVRDAVEIGGVPAARDVASAALRSAAAQPPAHRPPTPESHTHPDAAALRQELASIRRMVGQVLQTSARAARLGASATPADHAAALALAPSVPMPDALLRYYQRLIENEVAQEVADEVVASIRDELSPAELSDEPAVRQAVLRRLESLLPVAQDVAVPSRMPDGRPCTLALVGPTGVGKTTTIAKLAAAYRLRHGRRVALITSDTYRIAAVDQLRTYANIIGVPLRVVSSPEEMAEACHALRDHDALLLDTAGRSPRDGVRLEELRRFVEAARPHRTHLVLSSTGSEASLLRSAERFAPLRPDRVIFTKLDEAANLGVLVNVVRRVNAKLSYVTTGQEVPDDIEPGRADRLAKLVLDGKGLA